MLLDKHIIQAKFLFALTLVGLLTWYLPEQMVVKSRLKGAPSVMLWVWERPDDLSEFQGFKNIGVAYLAATINVFQSRISVHKRQQPLLAASDHYIMPVIRIETDPRNPPKITNDQVEEIVAHILQIAARPSSHGVQIDFDAMSSERSSYESILRKLRNSLPAEMPLSMTAIASWCSGDYWLARLPVDEVVPMYFDMGVSENSKIQYTRDIADSALFKSTGRKNLNCKCHSALGLSTSESVSLRPSQYYGKRVYLFSRHAWQVSSNKEKLHITKILKLTEAS